MKRVCRGCEAHAEPLEFVLKKSLPVRAPPAGPGECFFFAYRCLTAGNELQQHMDTHVLSNTRADARATTGC